VTADPRHADRGGRLTFVAPTVALRDTWVKLLRFLVDRLAVNSQVANSNSAFDASANNTRNSGRATVLNGIFGPISSPHSTHDGMSSGSSQAGHMLEEAIPPPSMFFFPANLPGLKDVGIDKAPIAVPPPFSTVLQYSDSDSASAVATNTASNIPGKPTDTAAVTVTGNSSEVFNSSINSSNSGTSYPAILAAVASLPASTLRVLPNLKNNLPLKYGSSGFIEDQVLKWSVVAAMKRGAFFLKVCSITNRHRLEYQILMFLIRSRFVLHRMQMLLLPSSLFQIGPFISDCCLQLPNNARSRPHERFVRLSPDVASLRWLSGAVETSQQQGAASNQVDGGSKTKSSSASLVPSRAASKSVAQVMSASLGLKRATHVRSVRLAEVAEIRPFTSTATSTPATPKAKAVPLSVSTNVKVPLGGPPPSSPSSSRERRYVAQTTAASIDSANNVSPLRSNSSSRQQSSTSAPSLRRPSLHGEQQQQMAGAHSTASSDGGELAEMGARSGLDLELANSQPLDEATQMTPLPKESAAKHRLSLSRLNPFKRMGRALGMMRASPSSTASPPTRASSSSSPSSSIVSDNATSPVLHQTSHHVSSNDSLQKYAVEAISDDALVDNEEVSDLPLPQRAPSLQREESNESSLSDNEGHQYEDFECGDDFGIQSVHGVTSPLPVVNLLGNTFDPSESAPQVERGVLRNVGGSNTNGTNTLHPPFFAGSVARPQRRPSPLPTSNSNSSAEATPRAVRRRSFGQFSSFTFSDASSSTQSSSPAHASSDSTCGNAALAGDSNTSSPQTSGGDAELGIVLLDKHKQVLLHLVAPSAAMRDLWCFGLDLVVKHWRPQTANCSISPQTQLPRAAAPPPLSNSVGNGNGPTRRSSHGRFSTSAGSLESIDSPVLPLSPISEAEEGPTPLPAPRPQSRPPVSSAADSLAVPPPTDSNESNGYSPFGLSADVLPENIAPVASVSSARVYDEPGDDFQTELGHNSRANDNHGSAASYTGFSADAFGYDPAAF